MAGARPRLGSASKYKQLPRLRQGAPVPHPGRARGGAIAGRAPRRYLDGGGVSATELTEGKMGTKRVTVRAAGRPALAAAAFAGALAAAAAAAGAVPVLGAPGAWGGNGLYVEAQITLDQMPPQMALAFARGIQEELIAHGYAPGPVDGVVGRRTRQAISAYQRDAGLPVTGLASGELLDHLKFVTPKVYARKAPASAAAGASKALVTDVQRRLYERGYYLDPIDGLAGPKTRGAVRRFQADANLPQTGVIDERLKSELELAGAALRAR